MDRVEDQILPVIGTRVTGDLLTAAANDDLMDIATDPYLLVTEGDGYRVIIYLTLPGALSIVFSQHIFLNKIMTVGIILRHSRRVMEGTSIYIQANQKALECQEQSGRFQSKNVRFTP
jgi:hypothetical protein